MDVSLHDSSVSVSMQSASPLSETRSDQGSKLESNGKMESVATPASEVGHIVFFHKSMFDKFYFDWHLLFFHLSY